MSVMETQKNSSQESDNQWGPRIPVAIDPDAGVMQAGEAVRPIDVRGDVSLALSSYLSMVYELRSMTTGVIPLRQEDLVALANAFEMEETDIAVKLARLMHCDDLQTRRFVQMVKKGRVLVPVSMVAAGALLAVTLSFAGPAAKPTHSIPSQSRASVEITATQSAIRTDAPVPVEIGDAAQVQRAVVSDAPGDTTNDAGGSSISSSDTAATTPASQEAAGNGTAGTLDAASDIEIGDAISVSRD